MSAILTYPIDEPEINEMIEVIKAVHLETMDYPPVRPVSSDSYLPAGLIDRMRRILEKVEGVAL